MIAEEEGDHKHTKERLEVGIRIVIEERKMEIEVDKTSQTLKTYI